MLVETEVSKRLCPVCMKNLRVMRTEALIEADGAIYCGKICHELAEERAEERRESRMRWRERR